MKRCSIVLAVSLLTTALAAGSGIFRGLETDGASGASGDSETSRIPKPSGTAVKSTSLQIVFTGDILLDRGVRRVIEHRGADALFSPGIDSLFRASQVVVGNLECPATRLQSPVQKRFVFRAEPEWLAVLRRHGITHLILANNHSVDQGREGLMDTRRNVLRAGIVPVGAGANMREAARPVLLASRPRRVWLVSSLRLALENYALLPDRPCVSQEPMDSLLERVHRLRRTDPQAVIVVSLHWGGEHTLQPVARQRLEAHQLVLAGADLLVGHHTHTLQTVETYRGCSIYYSVGNFIFDQHKPLNSRACVVRLRVGERILDVETLPVSIRQCVPRLDQ